MALPPQPWLRSFDAAESDSFPPHSPTSGRNSPNDHHERQLMLDNMAGSPMRTSNAPHILPPGAEPPISNTQLRQSFSAPSFEPSASDSAPPGPPFRASRASSSLSMRGASSPLNPNVEKGSTPTSSPYNSFIRPASRASSFLNRVPSEEIRALAGSAPGNRGSFMILYRRAELDDGLPPPSFPNYSKQRNSFSSDVHLSLSSDSKYPSGMMSEHGLVAYAYDPSMDEREPMDDEDMLHNPDEKTMKIDGPISWRGLKNIGMLAMVIATMLCLFVLYPVYNFYKDNGRNELIVGNTKINATGQAEFSDIDARSQIPIYAAAGMIDPHTPEDARTRLSPHGDRYTLVFSDEFEASGRIFSASAADALWSLAISDNDDDDTSSYSKETTTQDGNLVLEIDERGRSVALLLRTHFCFVEGGFVVMNVRLPHADSHSQIFWSRHWTMSSDSNSNNIPPEILRQPMALTMTLGSPYSAVPMPGALLIDYVRIYQRVPRANSLCDESTSPMMSVSFPW